VTERFNGGTTVQKRRRAVVKRRGWVTLVTVATVMAAAAGYSVRIPTTYTATAIGYVNPGATSSSPGNPSGAAELATTYAGLIPDDSAILIRLAKTLGTSPTKVHRAIKVLVPSTTGLLDLQYKASTPASAIRGATALALALAGGRTARSSVPPSTIRLASLPTSAVRKGSHLAILLPAGVLVGLLLGLVLTAAWESLDARVDVGSSLKEVLRTPVADERQLLPEAAPSLVDRWRRVSEPGSSIALVATRSKDLPEVKAAAAMLYKEAGRRSDFVARREPGFPCNREEGHPSSREVAIVPYGAPGSDQVGQEAALSAGTVVLVVVAGSRRADVEAARSVLSNFGHAPDWGLLLPASKTRRTGLLKPVPSLDAHESDSPPSGERNSNEDFPRPTPAPSSRW